METKETSNVGERIKAIRLRLGLNQFELGEKLGGLAISTISGYESGDRPPRADTLLHIAMLAGVSLDWLITGKEASAVRTMDDDGTKKAEIAATIEPGRKVASGSTMFSRRPVHQPHGQDEAVPMEDVIDESFIMSEMVTMTIEVLESKTVYRSALASNVRAFHQAVKMEVEMHGLKEEVQKMRAEHREEMEELKEMIRSLGGAAPQKRDSAANA